MKSETLLKSLYKAILKDCKPLFELKTDKLNEEIKIKESKTSQDELSICEIIIDFMDSYQYPKLKTKFIPNSISKFIKEIMNFIYLGDPLDNPTEHDIYRAYGLLWSLRYTLNSAKIEEISNFNFKDYEQFASFLNAYGMSRKLSKNYRENFKKSLGDSTLNENFVYSWLKKLNEKKLSSMKVNSNNNIKKESKGIDNNITAESKVKDTFPRNTPTNNNLLKNASNCTSISINNNINSIEMTPLKVNQIAESEHLKIANLIPSKINKNNNLGPDGSVVDVAPNKIMLSKDSQSAPSNNLNICENNKDENAKNNNPSESTNDLNNSIKENEDSKDITNEQNIQQNYESEKERSKNFKNKQNIQLNGERETKNKSQENSNSEVKLTDNIGNYKKSSLKRENYSYEQLANLVVSLKDKLENMRSELENTNKRVSKLEINQCLMYHQLSLYENSRDLGKSICHYFFEYLDTKILCKNKFEKLKII